MKKFLKDKRGYTLVELMVVVTIMAILAAASMPVFNGYIKKAKASEHLAECRAVYMAAEAYLIGKYGIFDGTERDFEDLEEEVEELTALDVEILEDIDEEPDEGYGIVLSELSDGSWKCEAVTYVIDNGLWIFDTESGEWKESR